MFVGIVMISPDNINVGQDTWADNGRNIAKAIQYRRENFRVLVDGTDKTAAITIPISGFDGIAIVAKDKTTLLTGLKIIKPGARLRSAEGNLGFVTGSYDREKVGAWIKTKVQAKKQTGDANAFDRGRLNERAYYVIVSRAATLVNNQKSVVLHDAEIQLNALAGLISGKLTKDEAVDNLFRELLIA